MQFKTAKNYKEYLDICKTLHTEPLMQKAWSTKYIPPFEDLQEWESFFNVELQCDEDTGEYLINLKDFIGEVGLRPKESEYPILLVYSFDESNSRYGKCSNQVWYWKSLSEIGLEIK